MSNGKKESLKPLYFTDQIFKVKCDWNIEHTVVAYEKHCSQVIMLNIPCKYVLFYSTSGSAHMVCWMWVSIQIRLVAFFFFAFPFKCCQLLFRLLCSEHVPTGLLRCTWQTVQVVFFRPAGCSVSRHALSCLLK